MWAKASLIGALLAVNGATFAVDQSGVFVLGVDGMDPVIARRLMDSGKLPHLKALADQGSFTELGTTTPPQSPVAWSTFVTGMDPGGHGLFDFIHRDPATYLPISSATPPPSASGSSLSLFGYSLPSSAMSNNRSGTPFWDTLHAAGVDVEVYRIPGNYPTPPSKAKVLAGMGTVDMRGGYGTYTWVTDRPIPGDDALKGDVQVVTVIDRDLDGRPDTANTTLKGPPDPFGNTGHLTTPLSIHLDPETETLVVKLGSEVVLLTEGEWSDWVPVHFSALPLGLADVEGRVQLYAKQIRPTLQLYLSPVNIAAGNPAQTLSSPDNFATELHGLLGDYFTQGMPEETNALSDTLFDDDDYQDQVGRVQADSQAMLTLALERFETGDMTFFYLSDIDLQCHMLWRHGDPKTPTAPPHPASDPIAALAHGHDIEGYYQAVDEWVGRVHQTLPKDTLLLVMSDHGFQPYTRKVHLNAWLRDNGWLTLKEGATTGHIAAGDVDWSKTKAYALGFNGLYLNLKGREGQGVVPISEAPATKSALKQALLGWRDGDEGSQIVLEVADSQQVYSPQRREEAPDLIVGYNIGYGSSEESTLGEITTDWLEDNTDRWSGNHLMAPSVVPGVLFSSHPIDVRAGLSLPDVTATLLHHYGLASTGGMVGHPIFR